MDPEAKRKKIGAGFIRVFDDFAKGLEQKHGVKPRFLVQVRFSVPLPAEAWLRCSCGSAVLPHVQPSCLVSVVMRQ